MTEPIDNIFSFGTWIRRRRKALDLTQTMLADRVGCAVVTIRKLEAEVFRPSRDIAERLADCLDVPPDQHRLFLQAARGERSIDRFPTPPAEIERVPHSPTQIQKLVEQIPLDIVPPLAPLPQGSRMPLSRNPIFVGREADLRQLAAALHGGGTAAIGQMEIAAATGLGGIGKTQLACEFVHRYGHYFAGGVFWLSFADPDAIPAEVAACGDADGMHLRPEFRTLPLNEQVKLVLAAWESPLPRLLVFDNCEEERLLDQWRPKHGGCRVLLTSRRRYWDTSLGVQALPLDVLHRTESIALLRTFRSDLPPDGVDLTAIAEAVGDLPLALHLAGSFLAKYRHVLAPAQYCARLQTPTLLDDRSLQATGLSPTKHVQHVARTFEQSYERLDPTEPTDALARTLLAHAACFAPGESLPRWLLLQTLDLPEQELEHTLLIEDGLTRLIDLGLLEADAAGDLRLHRLLVAFVQAVLVNEAVEAVVEATMLRVADELNHRRDPRPLLAIQPHLRFIVDAAQSRADAQTAGLYCALGYHLGVIGVYPEAQHYFAQALAIHERVLGPDHPDTARTINYLGRVLNDQGQYTAAQRCYEQALAIHERVLGPDHPDTARSISNLGGVLYQIAPLREAQAYFAQALAIHERVLGPDHPDTATSLQNLGKVFRAQGQYTAAQHYLEQALAIHERVLGLDHPDTARTISYLGDLFHSQGQYALAQAYFEQALTIEQRVLGDTHPWTAITLNNLGKTLKVQRQDAAAQAYFERALGIWQQGLSPDHPWTALSLNNLGELLKAQGQDAAAQAYFERALGIWQQELSPDHPWIALSLDNLGEALGEQGHYTAAQRYLEQALAIHQRAFGLDHPDTARTISHLGSLFYKQGQYTAAQPYLEQALAIRQRMLGLDHPDTGRSLKGLGKLLHAQGRNTQARSYIQQALAIFEQRLGPQHPDADQTRRMVATLDATLSSTDRRL